MGRGAFTSGCSAMGREPGSQALPGRGWAGAEDKGHFLHPLGNAPDSWWGDPLLGYWRPGKPVWLTLQVPHAPRGSSGSPGQTPANCPGTTALEPSGTHTLSRCLHPRKRSQSLGSPAHGWGGATSARACPLPLLQFLLAQLDGQWPPESQFRRENTCLMLWAEVGAWALLGAPTPTSPLPRHSGTA